MIITSSILFGPNYFRYEQDLNFESLSKLDLPNLFITHLNIFYSDLYLFYCVLPLFLPVLVIHLATIVLFIDFLLYLI